MSSPPPPPSKWKIASVVAFYMTSALVMVFTNKAVLISAPSLPLTFLLIQLVIAIILLHIFALLSPQIRKGVPLVAEIVAETKLKWPGLWKVVTVNVVGLIFNTLCLRAVDASFFQIARGLVLPLTILVSSIVIRSRPSSRVIVSASIVTAGFLLGVAPSITQSLIQGSALSLDSISSITSQIYASPLSLVYGVLSSLFIAMHAVYIKDSLPVVDNSAIALAWWSNAAGAVLLLPAALLNGELSVLWGMVQSGHFSTTEGRMFMFGSLVTGVVGFLLCIAGLLSIKVTSPITHMFSSAARSVLQTLFGVWLFGDILTVSRAVSILVILLGTMYYTWVKSQAGAPKAAPAATERRADDLERGETTSLAEKVRNETIWKMDDDEDDLVKHKRSGSQS